MRIFICNQTSTISKSSAAYRLLLRERIAAGGQRFDVLLSLKAGVPIFCCFDVAPQNSPCVFPLVYDDPKRF